MKVEKFYYIGMNIYICIHTFIFIYIYVYGVGKYVVFAYIIPSTLFFAICLNHRELDIAVVLSHIRHSYTTNFVSFE